MVAVGLLILLFVLASAQDVVVDKEVNEAVTVASESDPSTGTRLLFWRLTT